MGCTISDGVMGVNERLAITTDVAVEHRSVVDGDICRQFGFLEMFAEMGAHEGVYFCRIEGDGCGVNFYAV